MPKRRIFVAFEPAKGGKHRKFAVSVDQESTNDALAREVAQSLGVEGVKLEIGDGFELRDQDTVDMILDSDVVIARPCTLQPVVVAGLSLQSSSLLPASTLYLAPKDNKDSPPPSNSYGNEKHDRFRLCLVTAEIARTHAKTTLKESTEPANGLLAFEGHFISGNTTVSALRQEAVEVFGWNSLGNSFEDAPCRHESPSTCSCAIAHEVELHGLSSTLHCRFSIDGTRCTNEDCSYSHAVISSEGSFTANAPHCTVCADALAFPCPSCLKQTQENGLDPGAIVHCAIVKNAGCGHLHHAHCLGPRRDDTNVCPSGCSSSTIHREAIPFDQQMPTITLVWDGDKIDNVPIPPHWLTAIGSMQHLKTQVIINVVEEFLRAKSVDLGPLSLRIHARVPTTETINFNWTTLVSVCSSNLHKNQDYRRFSFLGPVSSSVPEVPITQVPKNQVRSFQIDFHTSSCPIAVCGCTRLKDIFLNHGDKNGDSTITLYVVRRSCDNADAPSPKHGVVPISKQSAYQLNSAWQPSTHQTRRGMAALLSSLLVLSEMVRKKGVMAESKVLAALYSITRFPPAVRAHLDHIIVGVLMLNIAPQPEEKAALSDALFHALKDFSSTASQTFTLNPGRRFETVRILLGHLLNITDTVNTAFRPLQSFSLLCTLSHKRLVDPVVLDYVGVVERSSGTLYILHGPLHRPSHETGQRLISDLGGNELRQVLAQSKEFSGSDIYVLVLRDIGTLTHPMTLENAGCDFQNAIKQANDSDLICRGPLELKSPSVVPPQIVLDNEGLLAVFMGRGCSVTRDVNFFRPVTGGDTEVDVNDVEHALQKVIASRKVEDTWDVDCFGGIPAKARTPDEAIVLCLDLSQSMNEKSAVGESGHSMAVNPTTEGENAVDEIVKDLHATEILSFAKQWIKDQDESCYNAWKSLMYQDGLLTIKELVEHLCTITQRCVLKCSLGGCPFLGIQMFKLASFSSASRLQCENIVQFLRGFITSYKPTATLGLAPYDIPRDLMDPATGNLLSREAIPSKARWVLARWVVGQDILNGLESGGHLETVTVVLLHNNSPSTWKLPVSTPTRILYNLANRVTEANYSSFTLRMTTSKVPIRDSAVLPLSSTDLGNGGTVELSRLVPHSRKPLKIVIATNDNAEDQTIILPADASALALLSHARGPYGALLSEIRLWDGLRDVGDGERRGFPVELDSDISQMTSLWCNRWHWIPTHSAREESRSLTRLQLLKELFNIFLNRVSSFDTSVSLVLGLVTFSDTAVLKQELTPIFENFRLELDKVQATGDTAMYDALDLSRSCLANFRRDLPNLRRRIIIVSDGEDTNSLSSLSEVGSALQRDRITVDSVQVGQTFSSDLHKISAATGGYRFFPKTSLGDALSIFDLETMLNSAERPVRPILRYAFLPYRHTNFANGLMLKTFPTDVVSIDQFPERKQHPRLAERVKDVRQATGTITTSTDRTRRIMRELKALISDPHPQIDVYVNDSDISFLKVIIQAPDDIEKCPYKCGCFLLTCDLPPEYPRDPPEIRFVTFILHPNVSKQGKVCVAELSRLWSSDITLKELLSLVYGLLLEPDLDNPLEIQASLKYYDDDGTFALAAAKAVKEHAFKSREAWREELDSADEQSMLD